MTIHWSIEIVELQVLRHNFYGKEKIAYMSDHGIQRGRNQSVYVHPWSNERGIYYRLAIKCLCWLEKVEGIIIQHAARTGGETVGA